MDFTLLSNRQEGSFGLSVSPYKRTGKEFRIQKNLCLLLVAGVSEGVTDLQFSRLVYVMFSCLNTHLLLPSLLAVL
jgi:hypothetical protein